jgi:hypothetical protein
MVRWGLSSLLGAACLSTIVGCAGADVPVAPHTAVAAAATPVPKAEPLSLARDAEYTGNEHHISILEGKIAFKVHAVELPKLETRSTHKGLLYSTLDVKLSEEQMVHCVAYASMVWPGGFVAADLTGEHDWANDGSETPDAEAKTTSDLARFDVATISGRPTISARATVKNPSSEVIADRKIMITSTAEYTLSCSDRTIGFDKRFNALVTEAMGSLVVDPPNAAATKVQTFRTESSGTVTGYKMVETFVDDAKKVTTTYTNETEVKVEGGHIVGKDRAVTSTANAKGEETAIHVQVVLDGEEVVQNLHATKDKKGWRVLGISDGTLVDSRYPAKTSLVSEMSPAWNARIKAAASSKKSTPSKLTVLTPGGALSVVAKRNADGSVALASHGRGSNPKLGEIALDSDGVASMITETTRYQRIRFRASKTAPRPSGKK